MKKVLLSLLAVAALVLSCQNYDDEFAALNAKVATLEGQLGSLASIQSAVNSLQSAVSAIPGLAAELASIQAAIDAAATAADIEALQAELNSLIAANADALAAQGLDINAILGTVATYTGHIDVTNSAELAFAKALGQKVKSIKGNVRVTISAANGLTAAEVNTVTSLIQNVDGDVTITSIAGQQVDISALETVSGNYLVTDLDAKDDALIKVDGAVTLDYDGGYEQPNLLSAGSIVLVDYTTSAAGVVPVVVGTLKVNFKNAKVTGVAGLRSGATAAAAVAAANKTSVFASATSVIVNSGVKSLTANSATDVQIWAANNTAGLTVSATKAASVVTIAGRVDDGAATPAGQALTVTGSDTSTVNANAVVKVGAVDITAKTVNMSAMTDATSLDLTSTTPVEFAALKTVGAFTAASATSVSAPSAVVSGAADFTAAKTIEVADIASATLTAAAVTDLTLGAQSSAFAAAAFTTLVNVDVTGKAATSGAFTATAANAALASATFGGELDAVSITGPGGAADKLTSFTTSGDIDSVTLVNNNSLVSVSLGHDHISGGAGSVLVVTGNDKLTSLTTAADFLLTLTITGNPKLASLDLSSYKTSVTAGAPSIAISGNALTGTFTPAKIATATTAYVEAIIGSADLATLLPAIAAIKAIAAVSAVTTIAVDIDDVDATTAGAQNLSDAMAAAQAVPANVSTVIDDDAVADDANDGINTIAEFELVK